MTISKREFKFQPAAKHIATTIIADEEMRVVKNRRSVIAAIRRQIANIDRTTPPCKLTRTCPLTKLIMDQLSLTYLSDVDQKEIVNLWEWLIGLHG